jgi:hypothetical protein
VRVKQTALEAPAEKTHQVIALLRGYLIPMSAMLLYHVLDLAGVVRHLR